MHTFFTTVFFLYIIVYKIKIIYFIIDYLYIANNFRNILNQKTGRDKTNSLKR